MKRSELNRIQFLAGNARDQKGTYCDDPVRLSRQMGYLDAILDLLLDDDDVFFDDVKALDEIGGQ